MATASFEATYRVRFDESGPGGQLPASGFLRYAQDLAWLHSDAAGFGRSWYRQRGLTWLIRGVELEILDNAGYGERLNVSTEVLGFRRAWARRRSHFTRADNERPLALATTDWMLLGGSQRPTRIPPEILNAFSQPRGTFTPLRVPLPATPAAASTIELSVRRSELDPMGHVNNAAYLDYMDEHLAASGREEHLSRLPRRYRVEFVSPAEREATLRSSGWDGELAWLYRLEAADGTEVIRGSVETDPATWVGG